MVTQQKHFTSVYKKYTNFGMQKFRLNYEFKRTKLTNSIFNFKVKRYLIIADTYLYVTLPNIYSPVYPFDCTGSDGVWIPCEFQWINI